MGEVTDMSSQAQQPTPDNTPVASGHWAANRIHLYVTLSLALLLLLLGGMGLSGRLRYVSDLDSVGASDRAAVKQYHEHAKQFLAACQDRAKKSLIGVMGASGGGSGKAEFADEYTIDVRKTGSLVRPYVGELRLRRKMLWDKWDGAGKPDEGWKELTLISQYEGGSWKTEEQQISDAVQGSLKNSGRADAAKWEYRTLDYGQPVIYGSVEELGEKGWEVYAVTGGQPYVASSQTTKDGAERTSTTNAVKFAPRVYHLKRQK